LIVWLATPSSETANLSGLAAGTSAGGFSTSLADLPGGGTLASALTWNSE